MNIATAAREVKVVLDWQPLRCVFLTRVSPVQAPAAFPVQCRVTVRACARLPQFRPRVMLRSLLVAAVATGLLSSALGASAPSDVPRPFILFASWPLQGHATPLAFTAIELSRRNITRRIVLANTGFAGGPHGELKRMFGSPEGEGFGSGVEYMQVGFLDRDSKHLVNHELAVNGEVRQCLPLPFPCSRCV